MTAISQTLVWKFATAFRRHLQQEVTYLKFQGDSAYRHRVLDEALQSGNEELLGLAHQIIARLDEPPAQPLPERALLQVAPHVADGGGSPQGASTPSSDFLDALRGCLEEGGIELAQRSRIDLHAHELGLSEKRAVALERGLRREMGLPPLDWYEEIGGIVQAAGGVNEDLRQRLRSGYVRPGRLNDADFTDHLANLSRPAPRSLRMMGSVSLVAVALAGVITLGFVVGSKLPEEKRAGVQPDTASASVPQAAADTEAQHVIHVAEAIQSSTVWHADTRYVLEDVVFVEAGASLTIEAGTQIMGNNGSALVVTKDARLYARGREDAPIVFTSARPEGQRQRGDWGGVVMLGNAPINRGAAHIEGVEDTDPRGRFGGSIEGDNCGLLEYVRIEFAGYEAFANNELNGLTLGGCGNRSIIRHVQVHKALDDGIEVFGGDVDLSHILITGARDDSFDWDMGWQGRVQFLVVQQHPDAGDNAFEADNWKQDHDAEPRSAPTFYNVTLVGALNPERARRAMTLRRGTAGSFRNFIITGFDKEAVDVRDASTAALAASGKLSVDHSLFYEIGADGRSYFAAEAGKDDDDAGFMEDRHFRQASLGNRFDVSPQLSSGIFDTLSPDFSPLPLSPATEGAAQLPEDEFWDQGASYLGAIRPGAGRSWLSGWTAYPKG